MASDIHRSSRADRQRIVPPDETAGTAPKFRIYSQVRGNDLEIYYDGPLGALICAEAREAIIKHTGRSTSTSVVLDLKKSDPVDTAGLSLLVELRKILTAQGRDFTIQNPSRSLLRILNITRASRIFQIREVPTADDEAIRPITKDESETAPQQPGPHTDDEELDGPH